MLCYAMLCYAMLCYAMLCYAMLCYAMLCYDELCYSVLPGLLARVEPVVGGDEPVWAAAAAWLEHGAAHLVHGQAVRQARVELANLLISHPSLPVGGGWHFAPRCRYTRYTSEGGAKAQSIADAWCKHREGETRTCRKCRGAQAHRASRTTATPGAPRPPVWCSPAPLRPPCPPCVGSRFASLQPSAPHLSALATPPLT
jgi:hypothetical protein